jgi:hypothetical protein
LRCHLAPSVAAHGENGDAFGVGGRNPARYGLS